MKIIMLIVLSCFVISCDDEYKPMRDQSYNADVILVQSNQRFTVTRVSVVKDTMAYGNERGVYIIKDNQTGLEYVGVSGIGIAETGSHLSGKVTVQDER